MRLIALALVFVFSVNLAWAQSVGTGFHVSFNWGELLQPLIGVLVSVISGLLMGVLYKLLSLLGVKLDKQTQEKVDYGLDRAISYGLNYTTERFLSDKNLDVKSEVLASSIEYFKSGWPDTVKRMGLTDEAIKRMIIARVSSKEMSDLGE